MTRLLFLLAVLLVVSPRTPAHAFPPDPVIVAMAQHLVQEHYMFGGAGHYHVEFDSSYLFSQPRETLWVVVGGFVSDQSNFNSFTAAVFLDCPKFEEVKCWSLEKLSINGEIVLDRKRI
ncbi:MAG: hypothetical protein VX871_00890 [Pseudomonadota bacterium]|nr:hypothetical protein [Pseudomonadota bacterium]